MELVGMVSYYGQECLVLAVEFCHSFLRFFQLAFLRVKLFHQRGLVDDSDWEHIRSGSIWQTLVPVPFFRAFDHEVVQLCLEVAQGVIGAPYADPLAEHPLEFSVFCLFDELDSELGYCFTISLSCGGFLYESLEKSILIPLQGLIINPALYSSYFG
jgi:hypothetical protein